MLIVYGIIIGAAILSLVWGLTARPAPGRANLFGGLEVATSAKPRPRLIPTVGRGVRWLLPTGYLRRLDTALRQAAHPSGMDLSRLLGVKLALVLATVVVGIAVSQPLIGLVVAVALFFLPDYWVLTQREARESAIREATADTIDQLTLVVEAGLGFDAALTRVARTNEGPLAKELQRTVDDMRAGVPRDQALRGLADRTRLPEIEQLVSALIQAQRHGVTIAETLRIQSAELRDRRMQGVEEQASKLATKLIFPVMICFMPVFIVVLVAPSAIEIAHRM
jgi:tight adherence protein C